MAKSSDMGTLLTLGLVGAGIYLAWPYISQLLGRVPTTPAMLPITTFASPPLGTPSPAAQANCPTLSFTCADGTVLHQVGQGANCVIPKPWNCPAPGMSGLGRSYVRAGTPMRMR